MQDQRLQTGAMEKPYFLPTSMDIGVMAFRHWLADLAGPVRWPAGTTAQQQSQPQSRQQLLDRYNQHTKHCKNCSQVGLLHHLASAGVLLAVACAEH